MPLELLDIPVCWDPPPPEFLRIIEAGEKAWTQESTTKDHKRIPLLEHSNFYVAYHALNYIYASHLIDEYSFCEWGSGLGVVTCIAAQLGFNATGIEIESRLCKQARQLAAATGVSAQFIQASYREQEFLPGTGDKPDTSLPFPLGGRESSVVYAYPWPAEESFIETLFSHTTLPSALLVSFHGGNQLRIARKA